MKKEFRAFVYAVILSVVMLVISIICLLVGAGIFSIIPIGFTVFFTYIAVKAWRKYKGKDI